ncbi:uncharacterized protein V6R79_001967 [Siganus canaliculatus]
MEEHRGHDTVTAAAERTERQRELEGSRHNIQQRIQDRQKELKLLQQEVEDISRSADKTVEVSQMIFTQLIRVMEQRRRDVEQQVRSQQEAELEEPSRRLQENICSDHKEVKKIFCRSDQQIICYLCSMEEHRGHDTVTAAAERTERQRELEGSRHNIQQRIQDRQKELKLLQQEVEDISRSADKTVEDSQEIFTRLIHLLKKRRRAVEQQVRSQQEAETLLMGARLDPDGPSPDQTGCWVQSVPALDLDEKDLLSADVMSLSTSFMRLQENICSRHNEVKKIFCRSDQQIICYLCSMEEHRGHDTVTAAAERTERQRELEGSRHNIQQRIQDRQKELKLLQQEVEDISRSADKTVEDSQMIFTQLISVMEQRRRDVEQQVRSQQEAEVSLRLLQESPNRQSKKCP